MKLKGKHTHWNGLYCRRNKISIKFSVTLLFHKNTKFSVQVLHMWGESVRKYELYLQANLKTTLRYCYDVFWLKFTYEITVARIKAQDKYMGRIHFSTVHKPPDLSNSPHSHICKRFFFSSFPLYLRPNTSRNTSITIKYLYINSPNALQQHPEA